LSEQSQETPKALAAFRDYCELGSYRSLAKLNGKYGKNASYIRQLEKWSTQNNWQERVKAFDAEQVEIEATRKRAGIEQSNTEQAAMAREHRQLLDKYLRTMAESYQLGSMAAVQWLKNSVEAERKALGADVEQDTATQNININTDSVQIVFKVPKKQGRGEAVADDNDDANPLA